MALLRGLILWAALGSAAAAGAAPAATPAAVQPSNPGRGNAWEAAGPQGSKAGGNCVFTYKALPAA